jgi:glycosyltransferase involved in cell wall biosynthesis
MEKNKKMKILIYSSAYFSDNILPMYKEFLKKGEDVTCLFHLTRPCSSLFENKNMDSRHATLPASEFPDLVKYANYVDISRIFVENSPYTKPYSFSYLKSILRVSKFIKEGNFDCIHTDIIYLCWQMLLFRFRKETTLVIHEPIIHARKTKWSEELFRRVSFNLIPRLVILNKSRKEEFCETYRVNPKRVLVNKLGPLTCIRAFQNDASLINKYQIVYWGRIAEYKGIEYLCQAMIKVHEVIPEAKVIIAGGGKFYFDIEQYKKLPYFTIINRYLDMEEMGKMISSSAVAVCPYTNTSQSGGVLTSFALGCPVIASDVPAMREIIEHGKNGLLFEPRNALKLADAIISYLLDDNMQKSMRTVIQSTYDIGDQSWSPIVDKYLDFYLNHA